MIEKKDPDRAALGRVLDHRGAFRVCYSSRMADEYADVLHGYSISSRALTPEAEALYGLIVDVCDRVVPKFIPAIVYPDDKDRLFLEAAVYAHAILLTNNLRDSHFLGVRAIASEEFLGWCEKASL